MHLYRNASYKCLNLEMIECTLQLGNHIYEDPT